jgi:hypothetical protein
VGVCEYAKRKTLFVFSFLFFFGLKVARGRREVTNPMELAVAGLFCYSFLSFDFIQLLSCERKKHL